MLTGSILPQTRKHPDMKDSFFDPGTGKYMKYYAPFAIAPLWEKGDSVPEGHCVVEIAIGNNAEDVTPVASCVDSNKILIPRNSYRVIPKQHYYALMDCREDRYIQPIFGARMEHRSSLRFPVTLIKEGSSQGQFIEAETEKREEENENRASKNSKRITKS